MKEIEALSHGLKFGLPPKSINYSRWFLAFEKLLLKLKDCNFLAESNDDFNFFKTSLKTIAYKTYYSFRPHCNSLQQNLLKILKTLKADTNIVILKADKGNAINILDRENYQQKMYNILHDSSKFKVITENLFNVIIRKEDKVNRILTKLKNNKEISSDEYNLMYASGTKPGILYGLPKVHDFHRFFGPAPDNKTPVPERKNYSPCNDEICYVNITNPYVKKVVTDKKIPLLFGSEARLSYTIFFFFSLKYKKV